MRAVLIPNSDVPACADAEPDAVIARLADLAPLIDAWQDGRSAEEVHADRED
jgi:hypothetical protein